MARRIPRSIVDIPGEYSYLRQLDQLVRQEIFDWLDLDDVVKLRFCCRELVSSRYVLNRLNHDGLIIDHETWPPLLMHGHTRVMLSRCDSLANRDLVVDAAIESVRMDYNPIFFTRAIRPRMLRMLHMFRVNADPRFRANGDGGGNNRGEGDNNERGGDGDGRRVRRRVNLFRFPQDMGHRDNEGNNGRRGDGGGNNRGEGDNNERGGDGDGRRVRRRVDRGNGVNNGRGEDRDRGEEEAEVDHWSIEITFCDWRDVRHHRNNIFDRFLAYMMGSVMEVRNTNRRHGIFYNQIRYCRFTEWLDIIVKETTQYSRVKIKYKRYNNRGAVFVKQRVVLRLKTRNGQVFEFQSSFRKWE